MKQVVLNNLFCWSATIRFVATVTALLGACALGFGAAPASPWTFHAESFRQIERPGAQPEFLAGGFNGCEGAAWIDEPDAPGGGHLRFGAVHTDVAFRWDEKNGLRGPRAPSFEASAFRAHPAGGLIVAEQTCDRAGNVWVASLRAIEVFSPAGHPLGEVTVPGKRPAAIAFGGAKREWLFICTREAVWRLALNPAK